MPNNQYDAGHHSFLETIKVLHGSCGPDKAAESLINTAVSAGSRIDPVDYDSLDEFFASMEDGDNPITDFEGKSKHFGQGVFGLPKCPFAVPLANYLSGHSQQRELDQVTAAMNKSSRLTRRLRIGEGSALSPFCVMHQPVRTAMGQRITVGGRPLQVYQLGCSRGRKVAIAERWLEKTKVSRGLVENVLRKHACCFCFRLADQGLGSGS